MVFQHRVFVWRVDMRHVRAPGHSLVLYTSADEVQRASKFRYSEHGHRFLTCRSILRQILALHLGVGPGELRFRRGRYGKLELEETSVQFNVSHSSDRAVYVVSHSVAVGIDIEQVRDLPDLERLAPLVLNSRELMRWSTCPHAERTIRFFRTWTRKEAVVKALGYGLSMPLVDLDVGDEESSPVVVNPRHAGSMGSAKLQITHLPDWDTYVGAIAVGCGSYKVMYRDWM